MDYAAHMHLDSTSDAVLQARMPGRVWQLRRPGNLESMWEAMDGPEFDEDSIPYWLELWPAAFALAEFLEQRKAELPGLACMDLGCGLGLTAMVGQWLGARVLAVDRMREAAFYTRTNAALNQVSHLSCAVMDWRAPAVAMGCFKRIWAADIIYEKRFYQPVLRFLAWALAPGGVVWIAEPGRGIFLGFLQSAESLGWHYEEAWARMPQGSGSVCRVWELTHAE